MEDLSLHVLDVAENGVRAGARRIEIEVAVDPDRDQLRLRIRDDGRGMTEAQVAQALDPFFTTRTERRVGLGLPLLAEAARMTGGRMRVDSATGRGTEVEAVFGLSHIDRKPLGDLAQSVVVLLAGNPATRFVFAFRCAAVSAELDTADLREPGDDAPWAPEVLQALKIRLAEGIDAVSATAGGMV